MARTPSAAQVLGHVVLVTGKEEFLSARTVASVRDAVRAQVESLTREFDSVVAASRSSNADDEHDPEGATIAFERQQVLALLDLARASLAEIDLAAGLDDRCTDCGQPIGEERLEARPSATRCIGCARDQSRRR